MQHIVLGLETDIEFAMQINPDVEVLTLREMP